MADAGPVVRIPKVGEPGLETLSSEVEFALLDEQDAEDVRGSAPQEDGNALLGLERAREPA